MNAKLPNEDPLLTKIEAAHYLRRSTRWLELRLLAENPPPGFKAGRGWVFRKSELDNWLEQFRTRSAADDPTDPGRPDLLHPAQNRG
jgi:hypothetical protein